MIDIAFATDDNYAIGCAVAVHSTLKNLKNSSDAVIHILFSELNRKNRDRIEGIINHHGAQLSWIRIEKEKIESLSIKLPRYYSQATFFRLLLPRLLPKVNKILYLDVDLLIRDDVTKLFEYNSSALMHACYDMYMPRADQQIPNFEFFGLKDNDLVVNTGVALLNLQEMRESGLVNRAFELLIHHTDDMKHADQTALNIAYNGRIDVLPTGWNVFPNAISKKWVSTLETIEPIHSSVFINPKIVHFVGKWKPWHRAVELSFSHEWRAYLYESRWFKTKLERYWWVLTKRLTRRSFLRFFKKK